MALFYYKEERKEAWKARQEQEKAEDAAEVAVVASATAHARAAIAEAPLVAGTDAEARRRSGSP